MEEGSPPEGQLSMVDIAVLQPAVEQLERRVRAATEQLAGEQQNVARLETFVEQLEPIADFDIDLSALRRSHFVLSILGVIPVDHIERLRTSLGRIPAVLLTLRRDGDRAIVLLSGTQQHADTLQRAARSAYLNPISLPDTCEGKPCDVIDSLRASVNQMRSQIAAHEGAIADLRSTHGGRLQDLLWRTRASKILADALTRYGRLKYTYIVVGWVPESGVTVVTERLKQVSENIMIEATISGRSDSAESVPVSLRNPGILGAFQQFVLNYGRPDYWEIDPTLIFTLTFPLLFGTMFGDVGHGAVLAVLGTMLASGRIRKLRSMSGLGIIVAASGLVSIVFGFLYGSIFGIEDLLPAIWIRPMDNIMQILTVAIVAGVVLLTLGFVIGILNKSKARDWGNLFFGHTGIAGFGLYLSLVGIGARALTPTFPIPYSVLAVTAGLSGLAVMFSELLTRIVEKHRPLISGGIVAYVVQAFFELFETLISLLSNSLSYVRVGAFAVAHGGLSAVVFILARMASPGGGIVYWLVVAAGNLFVIGFEGMIVGIQALRLEYYEFFSKFFSGGGAVYSPLAGFSGQSQE
jgi:V/A-type H+-transporting ATPase subunit I